MTTITLTSPARRTFNRSFAAGLAPRLVASFAEFCAGARDGRDIEARYRSYARMSRSELAEQGMTRADIYRAALLGRPV